jgi:hypothetical protein
MTNQTNGSGNNPQITMIPPSINTTLSTIESSYYNGSTIDPYQESLNNSYPYYSMYPSDASAWASTTTSISDLDQLINILLKLGAISKRNGKWYIDITTSIEIPDNHSFFGISDGTGLKLDRNIIDQLLKTVINKINNFKIMNDLLT